LRAPHDGADHRVEAGAVAAPRQDPDFHLRCVTDALRGVLAGVPKAKV
jgi:hypothetical protein